jgi:hypothetical protein
MSSAEILGYMLLPRRDLPYLAYIVGRIIFRAQSYIITKLSGLQHPQQITGK